MIRSKPDSILPRKIRQASSACWYAAALAMLLLANAGHTAEQWGWKAEVRRKTTVEVSDPTTYPNQAQAEAAMRSLLPPLSTVLTDARPGHASVTNSSIQIEYSAVPTPNMFGDPIYTLTNPIQFGGLDLSAPLNASKDDELADAINERMKSSGPAACSGQDRDVSVVPLWGPGWTRTGNRPGGMGVVAKQYTYTPWTSSAAQPTNCFVSDSQPPYDDGRHKGSVYRTMEEQCPAGYDGITVHDPNTNGFCINSKTGVVRGTPHQCEATPISTTVGNPCDTVTGAKTETETDYSSDSISLTRYYNSHAQMENSFGPGWMHNYDRRIAVTRLTSNSFRQPSMLLRPSGVANFLRGFTSGTDYVWQSTSGNGLLVKQEGSNYRNYLRSGATELYDTNGYLLELVDAAGHVTTVERNEQGLVTKVTGPFGKTLTLNYNANFQLTSVDDPAGNAIQYAYGANDELISVTYQDGAVKQYHYEDPSLPYHLTGITDENGDRFSTFAFDTAGRTILTEHAGGVERLELEYFPTQTVVTDAAGTERIFQFTTDTSKLRKLTALLEPDATTTIVSPSYAADRQRRPTQVIDANGVITEFEYGGFHRTRKIEAKGTSDERITNYEYLSNNSNLVTRETTPSVFAGEVRSVVTDYGSDNLPDSVTISGFTPSGEPVQRRTTTTYNNVGQPITIDGPRTDVSDVTVFEYYQCGTGAECGQLKSITNALGHITSFDSYDSHGRVLQMTAPNGKITITAYNFRGDIVSLTERAPDGKERTSTFSYNAARQPVLIVTPDGLEILSTYDAAHLLRRVEDSHGNYITYDYDLRGNRTDEDVHDSIGTLKRAVDRTHDSRNRIASINSGGFETLLAYDSVGNLLSTQDPALAVTTNQYDALNRRSGITNAEQGESIFSYDIHGNVAQVTTANGAQTSYEYDDLGNMLTEVGSDRGTLSYSYDSAGNIVSKTDARGLTTVVAYDALNREIARNFEGGQTSAFAYDQGPNGVGRLTQMSDPSGQTDWEYNVFGQETLRRQVVGGAVLTVLQSYDDAGRVATRTLPSGKTISYTYNFDQLSSINLDGEPILSNVLYEPFGPAKSWTWGDGGTHDRNYDLRGLLTSITIGGRTQSLVYDAAGRITSQTDAVQALNYEYDLLGRLTSAGPTDANNAAEPLFASAPVLLTSIQTMKNESAAVPAEPSSPWLTVATKNVTATSAKVSLERGQVNTGTIDVKEKIGYIAIESGVTGTFVDSSGNSIAYETQITPEIIQGWGTGCFETAFLSSYARKPKVMASLKTHNGGDGGWLRRCSLNKTVLGLTVDEDKFGDAERRHNNAEGAGIVAFSDAFDAQFTDDNGPWGMEIAKVVLPSTAVEPVFASVTFRQTYATKPVVVVLPNKSGSNPASLRIRNVTKNGFEVVQVEPAPSDGTHTSMPIHYLAIETGIHSLPDGTKIEVGRKATKKQKHGAGVVGDEGWATIDFSGGTPSLGFAQTFAYDANGNRTGFTEQGASFTNTYAPESNRLLSSTGPAAASYTFDANGNILGDGSRTFTYDARDRLVAIDSGSTTYEYNGLGERVRKTGSTEKIFLYGRGASLIGEYDTTGNALQEFVYFGSVPVAVSDNVGVKLIHTDHLGTPREITRNGDTVWRWESDPFGATAVQKDPDGDGTDFTIGLRFAGQYYDNESGLHYNYFRTYDPTTGRYLESDPIGLEGGPNTYWYVRGNPLQYVDALGLKWELLGWRVEHVSNWWSEYRWTIAVCKDSCTGALAEYKAGYEQIRPVAINSPAMPNAAENLISHDKKMMTDLTFDILEAALEARSRGTMSVHEVLIQAPPEIGQAFCDLLPPVWNPNNEPLGGGDGW